MRAAIVATVLLASGVACGRGPVPAPTAERWAALSYVPADTPYLVVNLEPASAAVRSKLLGGIDREFEQVTKELAPWIEDSSSPGAKALASLLTELRAQPFVEWMNASGIASGGRFVIYGLSLWPVVRVEIDRAEATEALISRTLRAAELPSAPLPRGRWRIWSVDLGEAGLAIALGQRELVLAVMPRPQLARAWPALLGERRVAPSFAERDSLSELRTRYRFLPSMAGFVDTRKVIAALSGRADGMNAELAPAPLLEQECASDAARLAELMPRLAFGYERMDQVSFRGAVVIELPAWASAALERLRTRVPGITWPITGKPLLALGLAVDLPRLAELMNLLGQALERVPFRCPALANLNDAPRALDLRSVPPLVAQARGLELVLDEYVQDPPSASGHLAMESAQMSSLPSVLAQLSLFPAVQLHQDQPFELPLGDLAPSWLPSARGLWGAQRLVLTVGKDSARRAHDLYRAPTPERSPLFVVAYDVQRLAAVAPSMDSLTGRPYREVALAIDVSEHGLRIDVAGNW